MIRQVIGSTFKGGLAIFLIAFSLFVFTKYGWQDFWFLLCCFKAWVRVDYLDVLPKGFFDDSWIVDGKGVVHTVTDFHLRHSEFYQHLMKRICFGVFKRLVYSLAVSILGLIFLSWFWVKMGQKSQTAKILSGFEYVEPKILRKLVLKEGVSPYSIAGVPVPKNAEYQHMMIPGTTGAGKSNMIHHLLKQIRNQGDQAIILDTTGGIFARFFEERTDVYLNPLDSRSAHWNLWKEAKTDYVIDEIAESIISDTKFMDTFWIQSARQLFKESVRFLRDTNQNTYESLLNMTLKMSLGELKKYIGHTTAAPMLEPSIEKTALSVRASLANPLAFLQHLEETVEGLSLLEFMKTDQKTWLFLSCPTDQRALLKSLFSVWLSLAIKGVMARPENNGSRTWIIIDELASLNRLPSLMIGLSEIRKYGGCFVLGFQDLSQIEEVYGHACAKTLSNLTGTKVLFRAVDTDTATRVARYMGEQEKETASESISFGAHQMREGINLSHQVQMKPVVTGSQVMLLKNLEAFLKFPGSFPISKVTFPYLDCPVQNIVYMPRSPKNNKPENFDAIEGKDQEEKQHPGAGGGQQDAENKVLNSPCSALSLGEEKDVKSEIVFIPEGRY